MTDAVGHFPCTSPLTACTSCLRDHQWQSLKVSQSNVWTARCASFDRKVLDVINLMGVSFGKFSICVGCRKVMNTLVRLVRCGDDFSLCGRRSLFNAFRDDLEKHLLVKTAAVLGPNVEMGDVQETVHLNRLYPPGAEGGEHGSSRPTTLDTLRFCSRRWAWVRKQSSEYSCVWILMRTMARNVC